MKKILLRVLFVLSFLAGCIAWWVHWSPQVESILLPLNFSQKDFELKTTRSSFGTQPVLLMMDLKDTNVYSRYVAEILKAEGIFCFETLDISAMEVDAMLLHEHALVITTGSSPAFHSYKPVFEEYVRSGGSLLMIAPPEGFDSLLGIRNTDLTITDGYVQFDSTSHVAAGLSHVPLQFFGPTRLFEPIRLNTVARLASNRGMVGTHVGIGFSTYGSGKTGFVSYDLGRSVVITRYGKPPAPGIHEAIDKDGDGVFKTADLYFGLYDYANRAIPQADEQQKVLVNVIFTLLDEKILIPRVWYFPNAVPSVALLTGDHHGWGSQKPMSTIAALLDSVGGHFTFFVYPDQIDPDLVHSLERRGHGISPHLYYPVNSNRLMRGRLLLAHWFSPTSFFRPRLGDLETEIDRGETEFEKLQIGKGRSTRFHYLIWWGWSETPQLLAQKGYQLDLSISGVDPGYGLRPDVVAHWNSPIGYGYVNGSGQPMKVVTPEGNLVNLFTQLTQFEDDVAARDCLSTPPDDSVTTRRLIDLSTAFIDQSINNYHTALVWNFHPEHTIQRWPPEAPTTRTWIQATVAYLKQRHIPMLSAKEWLEFIRARRSIEITAVSHNARNISGAFTVTSQDDAHGVTLLIPLPINHREHSASQVSYTLGNGDRTESQLEVRAVNGVKYLVFQIDVRAHQPMRFSYHLK